MRLGQTDNTRFAKWIVPKSSAVQPDGTRLHVHARTTAFAVASYPLYFGPPRDEKILPKAYLILRAIMRGQLGVDALLPYLRPNPPEPPGYLAERLGQLTRAELEQTITELRAFSDASFTEQALEKR